VLAKTERIGNEVTTVPNNPRCHSMSGSSFSSTGNLCLVEPPTLVCGRQINVVGVQMSDEKESPLQKAVKDAGLKIHDILPYGLTRAFVCVIATLSLESKKKPRIPVSFNHTLANPCAARIGSLRYMLSTDLITFRSSFDSQER
jgi:hypothetical protein